MKQRIVQKASKLRAEDLERIAVLKRCGMFVPGGETASTTSDLTGVRAPSDVASKSLVQDRMAAIFAKTNGGADLLKMLNITDNNAGNKSCEAASLVDGAPEDQPPQSSRAQRSAGSGADISSQVEEERSEVGRDDEDMEPSEVAADE